MTISLLCANAVIFLLCQSNAHLYDQLKHYPFIEKREGTYYRWFTSGFVHANWIHLFMNLFVLYQFGGTVERIYKAQFGFILGGILFLFVYVGILILSGLPTYIKYKNNPGYASIGASGVVSGVLFIYILYFPMNLLYFLGMLPIPAALFGIIYLAYSRWASSNVDDHIDHDAHYYGALFGIIAGLVIRFVF